MRRRMNFPTCIYDFYINKPTPTKLKIIKRIKYELLFIEYQALFENLHLEDIKITNNVITKLFTTPPLSRADEYSTNVVYTLT